MATASTKAPAIYAALHKVMEGLASIPKKGQMRFGSTNYEYLRADDVQEKLNPLLVQHGVVVKADYTVDTVMRGRGEGAPFVYVNLALTYFSIEDGSEVTVSAVGEAAASDDKSINKALTQAIKNAHRATFQFASGEVEPDDIKPGASSAPDAPASPTARKVAAAKAPAKAPAKAAAPAAEAEDATAARDAVKAEFIDTELFTRDQVNALKATVMAEGLEGAALYKEMAKRLGQQAGA